MPSVRGTEKSTTVLLIWEAVNGAAPISAKPSMMSRTPPFQAPFYLKKDYILSSVFWLTTLFKEPHFPSLDF